MNEYQNTARHLCVIFDRKMWIVNVNTFNGIQIKRYRNERMSFWKCQIYVKIRFCGTRHSPNYKKFPVNTFRSIPSILLWQQKRLFDQHNDATFIYTKCFGTYSNTWNANFLFPLEISWQVTHGMNQSTIDLVLCLVCVFVCLQHSSWTVEYNFKWRFVELYSRVYIEFVS